MLKLSGCLILLLVSVIWGREKSKDYRERVVILDELCELVRYTQREIENYAAPVGEIFASFHADLLEKYGVLSDIRGKKRITAAEKLKGKLSEGAMAEVERFFREIGKGYKETEITLCRTAVSKLSEEAGKCRKELPEKNKMYKLMPVLSAGTLIILIV